MLLSCPQMEESGGWKEMPLMQHKGNHGIKKKEEENQMSENLVCYLRDTDLV